MKIIFHVFFILLLTSCFSGKGIKGTWKVDLNIQENNLPVLIHLDEKEGKVTGHLQNSDEKVTLDGTIEDGKFYINIGMSYAAFRGEVSGEKIKGVWIRTTKSNYEVPFAGHKSSLKELHLDQEKQKNISEISGNWKVHLGDDRYGIGIFEQKGARIKGSILTETGDYRYLDGYIKGNELNLFGFDGTFSFVLKLLIKTDEMKGKMFAGKSYNKEISAVKDAEFQLKDPSTMVEILAENPVKFNYEDITGVTVNFDDGHLKGKAKVVQIFGSWCPNCIDETHYFLEWRKRNLAKLNHIEFVAVAFEKFETDKEAKKVLRKLKAKMKMDYPVVLADFNGTKKIGEFFPVSKIKAYPTTIYLDKNNQVKKVYTGFAGRATGPFFDAFEREFNTTIDELIK